MAKVTKCKEEPVFEPVCLVLETQEEVDIVCGLLGNISGSMGKLRRCSGRIFQLLHKHRKIPSLFSGSTTLSFKKDNPYEN